MGGEGQGGLRDTNLPSSAGRGELSGGRASEGSFHKIRDVNCKSAGGGC